MELSFGGKEAERRGNVNSIRLRKRPAQLVGDPPPAPAPPAASMGWSRQGSSLRIEMMVPVATRIPPCTQWPAIRLRWLTILIRSGSGVHTWP